jgi:ubiquinone/menaquinone biosynthesis C-methylase UbiE
MAFNESVFDDYMNTLYKESTPENIAEVYTKFADHYEDICAGLAYRAHEVAVDGFAGLGLDKSIRILDVAAGQGNIGRLLKSLGYNNVDALDGTLEMLSVAKSQGIYKNYIHCLIYKDTVLPIENNTYDVTIGAGFLGKAHICIEVLSELIRITKSGITQLSLLFISIVNMH